MASFPSSPADGEESVGFTTQQRVVFAVLTDKQIRDGMQSSVYPEVNTLPLMLDAYYVVVSLPQVRSVNTTFNRSSRHVVLQVNTQGGDFLFMCFPCANAKRRMYELTWIITMALARAKRETSDVNEALALCRAHATNLCASYTLEPSWAQVQEALQGGAPAVVWTQNQVVELDFKPVLQVQFKSAFEQAGVAVCDSEGAWQYEQRLLGMQPSIYALGAKDGNEELWANNTQELVGASVYLHEKKGVQEIVKGGVVVYYE